MARIDTSSLPNLSVIKGSIKDTLTSEESKGKKREYQWPEYKFFRKSPRKPCEWKVSTKAKDKPFPLGRVELDILTNEKAAELGMEPGPAIRLCYGKDEVAPVVSVSSPQEALKIGKLYRDCVIGKGNPTKDQKQKCAVDALGLKSAKQLKLAGAPRRGARRRK